jgi:hypothetical protein
MRRSNASCRTDCFWIAALLVVVVSSANTLRAQAPPAAPEPAFTARANAILALTRNRIDNFFEQTSNVVCTETVSQAIVGRNNKPLYREESVFEYQMEASNRGGALRLTESREPRKAAYRDPYKTLLITNGFGGMLLILHKNYASSYVFEPAAEETIEGRIVLKEHFHSVPGGSSPAAVQLRGQNYPLPLKGDIWIDEDTSSVVQLNTSLDGSFEDLGLRELRSEIHYAIVRFQAPDEAYWMPSSAIIDVATPKQHWRNAHRFTDYRRFRATIQVQMGETQP